MIYDIVITKLSEDDGGGYFGFVPDLSGCVSDGDTPTEALTNTQDAILDWIDVQEEEGCAIPERAQQRPLRLRPQTLGVNIY